MALRSGWLLFVLALGCGGSQTDAKEPKTAKEKQLQEAKKTGDLDDESSTKWGGWRYQGERRDCRFVIGRRCFKTEKAACSAAACRATKCDIVGGGPATVSCHRDDKAAKTDKPTLKADKPDKKKPAKAD